MADSEQQQQQQQQKQQEDDEGKKEENSGSPKESARSPRRQQQQQQRHPWRDQNPHPPRHNKLYKTPPTPDFKAMLSRESSFVLDSLAVASISEDYSRANPKLGSAIPPYNSQKDRGVDSYFQSAGVGETLKKNKQEKPGTSIEGPVYDRFYTTGHGFRYLTNRNDKQPYAYSNEVRMGHGKLFKHPNPKMEQYERKPAEFSGFNGRFGYRRTTPGLREKASPFGVNTATPIH